MVKARLFDSDHLALNNQRQIAAHPYITDSARRHYNIYATPVIPSASDCRHQVVDFHLGLSFSPIAHCCRRGIKLDRL